MHTFDLTPRPETWVTLNVKQRGLGTASCGPDALDRYKIWPGEYRLELLISLRDMNDLNFDTKNTKIAQRIKTRIQESTRS